MNNNKLCLSYLMGVNDSTMALTSRGFNVEEDGKHFKISFPSEKAEYYEDYIINNLNEGYWNEYISDHVVFIFKFKNGTIKRFVLDENNHDVILKLCCEFASAEFNSIKDMLLGNDFYKNNVDINDIIL